MNKYLLIIVSIFILFSCKNEKKENLEKIQELNLQIKNQNEEIKKLETKIKERDIKDSLTTAKKKEEVEKRKAEEKAKKRKVLEEAKKRKAKEKKITIENKWFTDVNEAIKVSLDQQKPLFFFFTGSDWCGWCKRLQKEVFFLPEFKKWANENVVLVELDFPRRTQIPEATLKQNRELAQMFGVRGYPTVWFVSANIEGEKVNFNQLGSQGYMAGGPSTWITSANKIINIK